MKLSDFIQNVNDALRGVDDDAPTPGTSDWNYWVRVLNRKKNELYADTKKKWSGTYDVANLGRITAKTAPSFELDDTYMAAANDSYVITSTGSRADFEIIEPQEAQQFKQQVFISGQDPQTLFFTLPIKTGDQNIGGTLYLPGYFLPDDVSATQVDATIPLPDPYWGVMAVAAEIAANDLVYEDKEANLTAKANNLYKLMVAANRGGTTNKPRIAPSPGSPIPGTLRIKSKR